MDLTIGLPSVGKKRDPVGRFTNLADDFKMFEIFQFGLCMRSQCYWAFPWRFYNGFGIRFKGDVIFSHKVSNSLVWEILL